MRSAVGDYVIDDDPARIDARAAVSFLTTEAYWGRWRSDADIRRQIAESWRVVGVYDQAGAMVGFARAFGDGGTAYLSDVYILASHRGAGLGKAIMRAMVEDGPGAAMRWMLHTSDAHGLYRSFGFASPDGRYLERPAPGGPGGPGGNGGAGSPPMRRGGLGGIAPPGAIGLGGIAPPEGNTVRLEPLRHGHVPGLVAAAAGGGELYRWSPVPQNEEQVRRYVEAAIGARDSETAVPFAVVRAEDDTVIGSTRFFDLSYWAWPDGYPRTGPDTCEIGYTWLSRDAVRTGVNTEMKRLMLTFAFEVWQVRSVCLHTDARNQRSRDAMQRIGARFEGILRSHRLGADLAPRDSVRFSVTAADWPGVRLRLDELTRRYQPA
jgi:RimJ/RimL family protein N-acetyltransferase/GNAT superfamily N-acetyltransferase